jgi:SH3-like domain-containing protein
MIHAFRAGLVALCLGTAFVLSVPSVVGAAADDSESTSGLAPSTGLPVPRFVSLRSAEVNVRTGPGTRYPVEWVFVRRDIPVEITAEFDTWRRIRDWEGTEGWVHQSMLSGKRHLVIIGDIRTLRRSASGSAAAVARVEPGVIGRLLRCPDEWCEVELDGNKGWMLRTDMWGVYPREKIE